MNPTNNTQAAAHIIASLIRMILEANYASIHSWMD
jgi:hypothetical protein